MEETIRQLQQQAEHLLARLASINILLTEAIEKNIQLGAENYLLKQRIEAIQARLPQENAAPI